MDKQPNSRMCFVCGIENPNAPRISRRRVTRHARQILMHHITKTGNNETLDQVVGWSGSQGALLPPSPLRTVRATFTAHRSSLCKRPFDRTRL
jgi:hypothetical protein